MDTPNAVTLAAMEEARQLAKDPNAKTKEFEKNIIGIQKILNDFFKLRNL